MNPRNVLASIEVARRRTRERLLDMHRRLAAAEHRAAARERYLIPPGQEEQVQRKQAAADRLAEHRERQARGD